MTLKDIINLEKELKEKAYQIAELKRLRESGLVNNYDNEGKLIVDYISLPSGYGYDKGNDIGRTVISSLRVDWEEFDKMVLNLEKEFTIYSNRWDEIQKQVDEIK